MRQSAPRFTPPANRLLRWLMDAGPNLSSEVRAVLLSEPFASPKTVLAGLMHGLMMNTIALCLQGGTIFLLIMLSDIALTALRSWIVGRALKAAARHAPTPTDLYLLSAILWCGLQGFMACAAVRSGNLPLQILGAIAVFGITGPIISRNYGAPRYAMLLVCLCDFPYVGGTFLTDEPWLWVTVLQTPFFLFGCAITIKRYLGLSVQALQSQFDSQQQARHDNLTGLLNRRGLSQALSDRDEVSQRPFAVLCLDLDGFKTVNDTLGHQAGDDLLCTVAARLKAGIRATDILARLGGDEFVIIAPGLSPADSQRFANSIIERIVHQPCVIGAASAVPIGISIGVACAPEDGVDIDELRGKADAALYDAKRAGKGIQRRFGDATRADSLADLPS